MLANIRKAWNRYLIFFFLLFTWIGMLNIPEFSLVITEKVDLTNKTIPISINDLGGGPRTAAIVDITANDQWNANGFIYNGSHWILDGGVGYPVIEQNDVVIRIQNTTQPFVIRRYSIRGMDGNASEDGIVLRNVRYGTIENCIIYNRHHGIALLNNTRDCYIRYNEIYNITTTGIKMAGGLDDGSTGTFPLDNYIESNTIYQEETGPYNQTGTGIIVEGGGIATYHLVRYNFIERMAQGIWLRDITCTYNRILNNSIFNSTSGILLQSWTPSYDPGSGSHIHRSYLNWNNISDCYYGFNVVRDSMENNIYQNMIYRCYIGINICNPSSSFRNDHNYITENIIGYCTSYGILIEQNVNLTEVHENDFYLNNVSGIQGYNAGSNSEIYNNSWDDWRYPDTNPDDGLVDVAYPFVYNDSDISPLETRFNIQPYFHYIARPKLLGIANGNSTMLTGIEIINWGAALDRDGHPITYDLYYSEDAGLTYPHLIVSDLSTTTYEWNTTEVIDPMVEKMFKFKVVAKDGTTLEIVEDISDNLLTIHNDLPPPNITTPLIGTIVNNTKMINWEPSIDPYNITHNHAVAYSLYYQIDLTPWSFITTTFSTTYAWDTTGLSDHSHVRLIVQANCNESEASSYNESGYFDLHNRPFLFKNADTIVQAYGTVGTDLVWNASDATISTAEYTIYCNSTPVQTGTWTSMMAVSYTIPSTLTLGTYNFTIEYADGWHGNETSSGTIVIIGNQLPAIVTPIDPADQDFGTGGTILEWKPLDSTTIGQSRYTMWLDSLMRVQVGDWTDNINISYTIPASLSIGTHNYTLELDDGYGVNVTSSATWIIILNVLPSITSPPNPADQDFGTGGTVLEWKPADSSTMGGLSCYSIWLDTLTRVQVGDWTDGVNITYTIPLSLSVGLHNYTIELDDGYGVNMTSNATWITILNVLPSIISPPKPADQNFGTGGTVLEWKPADSSTMAGVSRYSIWLDTLTRVQVGNWMNGVNVSYTIPALLSVGLHNYTIELDDGYGVNVTSSATWITILNVLPSVIAPADPMDQDFGTGGTILEWKPLDSSTMGLSRYSIWLDTLTRVQVGDWTDNMNITYFIPSNLPVGMHNYTIELDDGYGVNISSTITWITILNVLPSVIAPADPTDQDFGTNETILEWTPFDTTLIEQPRYSIWLDSIIRVQVGDWISGVNITYLIPSDLPIGMHNYTIELNDGYGINITWIPVWITILPGPPILQIVDQIPSIIDSLPFSLIFYIEAINLSRVDLYLYTPTNQLIRSYYRQIDINLTNAQNNSFIVSDLVNATEINFTLIARDGFGLMTFYSKQVSIRYSMFVLNQGQNRLRWFDPNGFLRLEIFLSIQTASSVILSFIANYPALFEDSLFYFQITLSPQIKINFIKLKFYYTDSELTTKQLREEDLTLLQYDTTKAAWQPLPTTVYGERNTIEASLEDLSSFVIGMYVPWYQVPLYQIGLGILAILFSVGFLILLQHKAKEPPISRPKVRSTKEQKQQQPTLFTQIKQRKLSHIDVETISATQLIYLFFTSKRNNQIIFKQVLKIMPDLIINKDLRLHIINTAKLTKGKAEFMVRFDNKDLYIYRTRALFNDFEIFFLSRHRFLNAFPLVIKQLHDDLLNKYNHRMPRIELVYQYIFKSLKLDRAQLFLYTKADRADLTMRLTFDLGVPRTYQDKIRDIILNDQNSDPIHMTFSDIEDILRFMEKIEKRMIK